MNDVPSLVLLVPGFPADENDSVTLPVIQQLVRRINKDRPQLHLLIISFQYPFRREEYRWFGNRVMAMGGKNRGGLSRRWLWLRTWRLLNKLKKEYPISGVLSFWAGECAYVGKSWAVRNQVQHACWIMGQDAKKDNRFTRKIKPSANELIAISDFASKTFSMNHGIQPGFTIPLGIEPGLYSPGPVDRDIDILCAGSLIPLKQYHLAIELASRLKPQFPRLTMKICGQGPERSSLLQLIEKRQVQHTVELLGEKKHGDLLKLMQRSKLFIHTSSYEGFGIVCIEALAAGTPVISFTRPMEQAIQNWYHVQSPDEMADKARELLGTNLIHQPVMPYTMAGSARDLLSIFRI